jgi:hypothetical protein
MKVKNRQELIDSFSEGKPEMREVVAERDDVAQVDEDSFKDFCCRKAHGETIELLEDILAKYKKGEPRPPFEGALNMLKNNPSCDLVKEYLMQISKRKKYGKTIPNPQNKKINPFVIRAGEILDDLERCEGMKKSWFQQLKKEEETEKVAGAITTSSVAHSHLFKPTYGKRRKRKKKKEE